MSRAVIITEDISDPIDEGIKKFSFYLAKYVEDSGADNLIFSCFPNKSLTNVKSLPANKLLFSVNFFKKLYKSKPTLLIYVPFSSSTFMSFIRMSLLSLFAPKAKIIMVSVQERKHNYISKKVISLLKPDWLIVLSNKQANYYREMGFQTIVSPIGVEASKYCEITLDEKSKLRQKLNLPINEKIVLHVGHINKGRNLEILRKLLSKGFRVVIIASTRFESDLKLKLELEEEGYLFVSDYIENIEEYYQASDIYVFPVLSAVNAMEFPMSVLEAMSCNIPVITTRFGGIESFLPETNWFKYFLNEEELISKIVSFPTNSKCANRELVLSKFSWMNVFNNLFSNNKLV